MKQLESNFTEKGFELNLIKRVGDVALYERKRKSWKNAGYEVVRVRKYPTYTIGEPKTVIEEHESYPPDSAFGKEGWSCANLARAEAVFAEQVAINPYTTVMGEAKGGAPGRRRSEFELKVPAEGIFTVKDLTTTHPTASPAFIHLRLKELIAQGKVKLEGNRPSLKGKPTNLYKAVSLDAMPE